MLKYSEWERNVVFGKILVFRGNEKENELEMKFKSIFYGSEKDIVF